MSRLSAAPPDRGGELEAIRLAGSAAITLGGMYFPQWFEGAQSAFRLGLRQAFARDLTPADLLAVFNRLSGATLRPLAGLGAALAAASVASAAGGRLVVLGTPAEEGGGGKVEMARRGAYDGLDAAVMVHPADADLAWMDTLAIAQLEVSYEGQAAIELEQLADPSYLTETGAYPAAFVAGDPFQIRAADLLTAIISDLTASVRAPVIAARFHHGVAAAIEAGCLLLRDRHGLATVALSGGVFQNMLLLHATAARLEARGFTVLTHSRVPCNDGGISLGQAVIAAARDRSGT